MIKRLVFGDLAFVILWVMAACTQDVVPPVKQVNIARNLKFSLLPPESFGQSLSVLQSLEVQYKGKTHQLLAQLEITPKKILTIEFSQIPFNTFCHL